MLRKLSFAVLSFLKEPKKYYSLLFAVVFFVMLAVVVFQWGVSNAVVQSSAYDTFYYFAHSGSTQVVKGTENLIRDMRSVAAKVSMDGEIGILWNAGKPSEQEEEQAMEKLTSYSNYLSYIEGIYIYNDRNNYIYSLKIPNFSTPLQEFGDSEIVDVIRSRKPETEFSVRLGVHTKSYTEMSYVAYYPYNNSDNAVIIQGNFNEFNKVFDEFRLFGGSNFWLIDSDGHLFYGNEMFPESEKEKLFAAANSQGKAEYRFLNYNGKKLMFLSNYSEMLDLYFVFTVPKDEMYKSDILQKSMSFSLTLVFSILIGLLLVALASKFLAKRYELFKLKLEMPEVNFEKQISISREQFFHMLLHTMPGEGVREQWEASQTQLDYGAPLYLGLVSIDDYKGFCAKNPSEKDRELYKYGMINIICELLNNEFTAEGFSINAEQLVFFMNAPENAGKKIFGIFDLAREAIITHLDTSFTVALGEGAEPEQVANQFETLNDVIQYRYIYGTGSDLNKQMTENHSDANAPLVDGKIAEFSEYLAAGKTDEAREVYTSLMQLLSSLSIGKVRIYIVILANMFYDVFMSLEKTFGMPNTFQSQTVVERLLSSESLEEADVIYNSLICEIEQCFSTDSDRKYIQLCDDAERIIEENYSEPNLGLEFVAKELDISPSYLSRIFKKYRHAAIPTYILNYRLEKSKEMLTETNKSISQISSAVGFSSNSYFGVLFRKQFGLTPGAFREKRKSMEGRSV